MKNSKRYTKEFKRAVLEMTASKEISVVHLAHNPSKFWYNRQRRHSALDYLRPEQLAA